MCEKEGIPCEKVTGIGDVQEGACELLASALAAQSSVQMQPVLGLLECAKKPRIEVEPVFHDFGVSRPQVKAPGLAKIWVSNIGDSPLSITSVELLPLGDGHFTLLSTLAGSSLQPGGRNSFDVECKPTVQGSLSCNVRIGSNAVNVDAPVMLPLVVLAGYPEIAIAPESHDFGEVLVGKQSAPMRFVITNPGVDTLTVSGAAFGGAGFSIVPARLTGTVEPLEVNPQARLVFEIEALPGEAKQIQVILSIASDAHTHGSAPVRLVMTGVRPEIAVDNESWDFDKLLLLGEPQKQTFTLTNTGTATLTIASMELDGDEDFEFVSHGAKRVVQLGQAIPPGEPWPFDIACLPVKAGARTAGIVIKSDAQNLKEPLRITLQAAGIRPEIAVDSKQCSFGDILVGGEGKTRSFTVTNPGSAPLHITSIELSDSTDFAIIHGASPPSELAPADSGADAKWVVEVRGLPAECGPHKVRLLIRSDAQNEKEALAIALDAVGVAPDIGIDLPLKGYANVWLGSTVPQLFTLTNTGTAPLQLNDIALDDATHFVASGMPVMGEAIRVGESRTFLITSRPQLAGLLSARVTIGSNARSGPLLVPLTVTGLQPTVSILPSPAAVLHNAGAPNNRVLTAQGNPGGGQYAWTVQTPAVADFPGAVNPGNQAQATIEGASPGTTNVTVTYAVGTAPPAVATVAFHVVQVTITQGNSLAVVHPAGLPAANVALTAVGVPAAGTPRFRALVHNGGAAAVNYQGGGATVANLNATVVSRARGRSTATVGYTLAGVTAVASIDVNVTTLACSQVTWRPVGAANVVPTPIAACPHEEVFQQPHGAVATVVPAHEHHHGAACFYCHQSGRHVHHHVESGSGSAAVAAVVELRNEIHHLRGLLAAWVPGNPPPAPMPLAAQRYIANRPWLANIPVSMFDPAGWAPVCARCNGTGTHPAQCRDCGGGGCRRCRGTGTYAAQCRLCHNTGRLAVTDFGKMIGVLIARDAAGRTYRLRGVSGTFNGIQVAGPAFGAPNDYWARQLPNPANIPSASRGNYNYGGGLGDTFGKCAATHMLSQALDQGLELVSMAEVWIGATMNGRTDGQLQSSCRHCVRYFEHMLCDNGGVARVRPYGGASAVRNRGQRVAIQEEPTVYLSPAPAHTMLHGIFNAVAGSTVLWHIPHAAVATIAGAANLANVTVDAVAAGTTTVQLQYTLHGLLTTASIHLHVLCIVQAGPLALPLAVPAGQTVSVPPLPGAGTLLWQVANPAVARFAGGVAPGNTNIVTMQPMALGVTQLTVSVHLNGVATGATATITINVV